MQDADSSLPCDDTLPGLNVVRDELQLETIVSAALGTRRGEPVHPIAVLCHEPGVRCVLRCGSGGGDEGRSVILKLYRHKKKATEVFQLMTALWRTEFGGVRTSAMACPLAHMVGAAIVIQSDEPGTDLLTALHTAQARPAVTGAAQWLLRLHETRGLDWPRICRPEDDMLKAQRWAELLGQAQPDWRRHLTHIAEKIGLKLGKGSTALVPVHRDMYHAWLLFDGARVLMTDFDHCALGDPMFDLGQFWMRLLSAGKGSDAAEQDPLSQVRAFSRAYGKVDWSRAKAYAALTCLELMHSHWRQHTAQWRDFAELLLCQARHFVHASP